MKRRRTIQLFDGHTHSNHSPDGGQTIDELCQSAITHGLRGVTITDHCDMWFYDSTDTYTRMTSSIADAEIAREKYAGTLWVGTGVEVAEYMFDPTHAEQIMNLTDYDVIIGSVHSIAYDNWDSYSRTNFDVTVPREKILTYLKRYFAEMQRMIECAHINVLAHITCPFRYINGKYGRNIDVSIFAEQIEQILHDIIDKGIALELNTSGLNIGWGEFMPSREILACYSRLGGELITLGSDAHISQNVGGGLKDGLALLQEVGYKYYASYCNKKIRMIRIEDSSRFAEMY